MVLFTAIWRRNSGLLVGASGRQGQRMVAEAVLEVGAVGLWAEVEAEGSLEAAGQLNHHLNRLDNK